MSRHTGIAAAIGGLALLCCATAAPGQTATARHASRQAPGASGAIAGIVQDEKGSPIHGATVSAIGMRGAFAVTDADGRFELRMLRPGPYRLRARLSGFVSGRGQLVEVRQGARASSSITLRRDLFIGTAAAASTAPAAAYPVLAAGIGGGAAIDASGPPDAPPAADPADASSDQDRGELAWRLRHARRGILKDITIPDDVVADDSLVPATSPFGASTGRGQTGSSASLSSSLFAGVPVTGQFNLLTMGSLDSPARLFTPDSFSRSIAYVSLAAPVGEHGDWTVRGALTGGDISAWFAAGAYTTRAPARHRYDLGASYSTQRYDGRNPAALRQVSEGSRNVGALYGFDTFALTPAVSLAYGARVSRYDYLDQGLLLDPRISLTLAPSDGVRVNAVASRNALAPGAEEFLPPVEGGLWLPPQRTFSSIIEGRSLEPEHTSHLAVQVERDIKASTVALRVFHQRVDDQLITVFGRDTPSARGADLGHYLVGNVGDVDATGLSASFGGALASRVHGSVEYTLTRARWTRGDDAADLILLAPSAVRPDADRIHDLSTSIATEVPETSTRVLVFCRMTSARPAAGSERSAYDPRFDVQVHQSLPFMNFTSARWEMLVAVRNFFRDGSFDSSVFDELLVTQPPKRIVGGLTVRF